MELKNEQLVALRLGHLNTVQGIVGRLSGFSASAKTFCIAATAALIGFLSDHPGANLLPIGIFGISSFWLLDAYYLGMERSARDAFDKIAARPLMEADNQEISIGGLKGSMFFSSLFSGSALLFYLPFLLGFLLLVLVLGTELEVNRPSIDSRPQEVGEGVLVTPRVR